MYLGIEVGGTNLKYGIIDENNNIVFQDSIKTKADKKPKFLIDDMIGIINNLKEQYSEIKSLGIGFPGIVTSTGIVENVPNLPLWKNINLKQIISERTPLTPTIDNDANVAALAELYRGSGKEYDNFIYLTLGTGIGGAIIINNKIYRGVSGNAGEIGHIIIKTDDISHSTPYRKGVVEEYAGKEAIIALYKKLNINQKFPDLNSVKEINKSANEVNTVAGNSIAIETLEKTACYIGCALISTLNILDMNIIIIGGGISNSKIMMSTIKDTIIERALPHISKNIIVKQAKFTSNTGVIGAAILGQLSIDNY